MILLYMCDGIYWLKHIVTLLIIYSDISSFIFHYIPYHLSIMHDYVIVLLLAAFANRSPNTMRAMELISLSCTYRYTCMFFVVINII